MMSRPSRTATALTTAVIVCLLGVAIAAQHNPLGDVDTAVLHWLTGHRSPGLTSVATTLTDLCAPVWVGIWTLLAATVLVIRDRAATRGVELVATVAVAGLVCEVLKVALDRARPPRVDQIASPETAMSFPSGHVTGTAALLFGLAVIATRPSHRLRRTVAVVLAVVLATTVALTRLYLGAHWSTDVAAAMALAAAAAIAVPAPTARLVVRARPHAPDRLQHFLIPDPFVPTRG